MCDLGYEVTGIAKTGEEALEQADRDRPDVVLMDIMLAGKMDGRETALKIWEWYQIPAVFVTAYGDKNTSKAENLSVPGVFGYILKPFTEEELESEIEILIG